MNKFISSYLKKKKKKIQNVETTKTSLLCNSE